MYSQLLAPRCCMLTIRREWGHSLEGGIKNAIFDIICKTLKDDLYNILHIIYIWSHTNAVSYLVSKTTCSGGTLLLKVKTIVQPIVHKVKNYAYRQLSIPSRQIRHPF